MTETNELQSEGAVAVVLPDQKYFKIGEAAQLLSLKPHVLRYWETEFSQIRPQKTQTGQRLYRKKDVETLIHIQKLLYKEKFTIAGAKKALQQMHQEQKAALRTATPVKETIIPPAVVVQKKESVAEEKAKEVLAQSQQVQLDPKIFSSLEQVRTELRTIVRVLEQL